MKDNAAKTKTLEGYKNSQPTVEELNAANGKQAYLTSKIRIGKYGELTRQYLQEKMPERYLVLTVQGKLTEVILQAQREAEDLREELSKQLHEQNKLSNPTFLEKVRHENNIEQQIHEQIMAQVIYRPR